MQAPSQLGGSSHLSMSTHSFYPCKFLQGQKWRWRYYWERINMCQNYLN